ncbi:MAG: response regulator, partial [Candidatus Aminicenantales bacterium]
MEVVELNEKESILIIDDDESSCKSLALIFRRRGYDIETASSGTQALKKVQGKFFNVAFLDIKLPDVEGTELLASLKNIQPEMDVIMVTGYASLENAVRALNEGASAYITKPLNIDELLVRVREILERQRLLLEKKRAEEKLRESEERLKEAQRIGKIGNWEFDVKTGHIIWSDQVYELFERDPSLGPPTYEENRAYYYPEDYRRLQDQLRRATDFGEESDSDYHLNLPSGKSVYHRSIIKIVKDEKGKVIKLFGTIQDITEQKQAEAQLK